MMSILRLARGGFVGYGPGPAETQTPRSPRAHVTVARQSEVPHRPSAVILPEMGVFRGLRAVVAMEDRPAARRLRRTLEQVGAQVAVLDPDGTGLAEAERLDPQVVYVGADHLRGRGIALGKLLQGNPRLRWAHVLRFSSKQLTVDGTRDPTLLRLAVETKPRILMDGIVAERAQREAPFVIELSRLGPGRLLRAIEGVPGVVRVTICADRTLAQLDLANGIVVGALWKEVDPKVTHEGIPALAAAVLQEHGDVRIERRERATLENIGTAVPDALWEACANLPIAQEPLHTGGFRPLTEEEAKRILNAEGKDSTERIGRTEVSGTPSVSSVPAGLLADALPIPVAFEESDEALDASETLDTSETLDASETLDTSETLDASEALDTSE
ncbi:MAG: hypothetical protein KC416_06545, partial [Myxococcales bacterium]|nr:hypothetical protein [Myxococcales bacterium]